ncbi:MAG: hypothetical protein M0Z58_06955 [Nitrospiraceae bacterium]|nr:hypothetical protein [Nitrospiraceae bacterium]
MAAKKIAQLRKKPERRSGEKIRRLREVQLATFNILEDFNAEKERLEQTERATLNILDDFNQEKKLMGDTQRATLNILEDFNAEKEHYEVTQKATFNILDDFNEEKLRLEDTQRATLNILDDFNQEKEHYEVTQKATFNILDDFNEEKMLMGETQRALLNILDDFEEEKQKVEKAKEDLQGAHDVLEIRVEERTSQLRASLKEKEVLIKEIYHRTKNNMHIITNLISLQTRSIEDREMAGKMRDLQSRIQAMALVHEKLYKSGDLSKLDLKDYVTDLVGSLTASYLKGGRNVTIALALEEAVVSIDTAIPCGLIINELISNCMKYAFPPGQGGVISIGLHSLGDREIELRVADNGKGLPEGMDIAKAGTLGLKIVYNLAMQLMGAVEARPVAGGGVEFIVRFERG